MEKNTRKGKPQDINRGYAFDWGGINKPTEPISHLLGLSVRAVDKRGVSEARGELVGLSPYQP